MSDKRQFECTHQELMDRFDLLKHQVGITVTALETQVRELALRQPPTDVIEVVFDGPPGPEAGRFVEVEDGCGRSINAGEWVHRPDGYWVLRIQQPSTPQPPADVAEVIARFRKVTAFLSSINPSEIDRVEDALTTLAAERDRQAKRIAELMDANETISASYLRIRNIVGAFDTTLGGGNRFYVTERAIAVMKDERDSLRAELATIRSAQSAKKSATRGGNGTEQPGG